MTAEDDHPIDADSLRRLFKGGSVDFAGTIVSLAILFVGKAILSRYLDVASFGSVALGMTVLTVVSGITLLGMKEGVMRFVPRMDTASDRRDIILSGFIVGLGLPMAASAALFVGAPVISDRLFEGPELGNVFRVFALAIPFAAFVRLTMGTMRGYEVATPKVVTEHITLPSTRLALIGLVAANGLGAVGAAGAYLLSFVAAAVVGAYYLYKIADLTGDRPLSPRIREITAFSAPLAVTGIISMVLSDSDILLLGALKSSQAVGPYEVAFTLGNLFTIVVSSLGFIFVPMMSRYHSEESFDRMQSTYFLLNKWTMVATLPPLFVAISFPEVIISMTFGEKYLIGTSSFVVLALSFSLHAILGPNGGILAAIGSTRKLLFANLVTSLTNLALNFSLIPEYGMFGAAIATGASYLLLNVIYQYTVYHEIGILPLRIEMVRPVAIGVISYGIVYSIFVSSVQPTTITVLGLSFVYVVTYTLLQIRLGFVGEQETVILRSIEERFDVPILQVIGRISR